MTDDPQPGSDRNRNLAENETKTGRGFPMLAPTLIAVLAAVILLVVWLVT